MPDDLIPAGDQINVRDALAARLRQLNEKELDSLTEVVFDELELRCGSKLADMLTPDEFEEFGLLVDAGDEEAASALMDRAIPNQREIVIATVTELLDETVERVRAADEGRYEC